MPHTCDYGQLIITMQIDLQEELDKIESVKCKKHIDYRTLACLYDLILERKIVKQSDIPEILLKEYGIASCFDETKPVSYQTVFKYITVLVAVEDFHKTFQFSADGYEGWYVVYASDIEAKLCRKRHISLLTFLTELRPLLKEFHDEAMKYYNKRLLMLRPDRTMTEMKADYYKRIKAVKGEHFKAEKYVRTEQDLVLLEVGNVRKAFRDEVYGK